MGLSSFFKRGTTTPARPPVADVPGSDVQRARTRARQRLIGAAVLVAIGVIGFPLVFETRPRPISVDIPIDIPRKEGAPPLVMPAARPTRGPAVGDAASPAAATAATAATASASAAGALPSPRDEVITETRDEAARAAPAASRVPAAANVPPKPAASPVEAAKPLANPTPAAAVQPQAAPSEDGTRARALLEGQAPAAVAAPRFVVQVGAFADAGTAREARSKAERLGLKTYTQVVETPAGTRIRVRVGPFGSRAEADKASASARSAGLSAAVLTL